MLLSCFVLFYIVLILFCFFMLYRNKWVSRERHKIIRNLSIESKKYIDDCYESGRGYECNVTKFHELNYDRKYWSYDKMMMYFWVWDVDRMVNYIRLTPTKINDKTHMIDLN